MFNTELPIIPRTGREGEQKPVLPLFPNHMSRVSVCQEVFHDHEYYLRWQLTEYGHSQFPSCGSRCVKRDLDMQ